jgi:NADH-quinone oxidoreductase subunit L
MDYLIWLGLFAPLAGFLILMFSSSVIGRTLTGYIGCLTIFISFVCFATLLIHYAYHHSIPYSVTLYSWVPIDKINADFMLRIDPLSLLMTLIITGVGFLIHVYSNGYMEHDADFARFFACLNFFVFAMLLLVLAGHLLLLFVGWEGVGLASYLLIGFWYDRPAPPQAATKAFVVNRIGDAGLLVGLLLTFYLFGTGDMDEVSQLAEKQFALGAPILMLLTFLYFVGAVGKSAQIPLHVWLPDAMEGPTPVSALIHAATMVTAGVYLVVRMHAVFMMAPFTLHFVGAIGGATALFAALCAVGQTDLKRVLAYSTVSQLGLMFLACGVGAFYAAMFHLTTHAFVKGLLFLSAGNVVHMMHDETQMSKMGGLSSIFTKTHWLFLIGVLALSGVPPLAAFFSKDLILDQDYLAGFETFFYVGLAASILTAFYMMRAYCLTFMGKQNLDAHELETVKEAPNVMVIPVSILAILAVIGGFLGFCVDCQTPMLQDFLAQVGITLAEKEEMNLKFFLSPETILSIIGALAGVGAAYFTYTRFANRLGPSPVKLLLQSFYVDQIYDAVFVNPLKAFSNWIDGFSEPKIFEGFIRFMTRNTQRWAHLFQKVQSGQIRSYVAWMAVGTVFLVLYFVL